MSESDDPGETAPTREDLSPEQEAALAELRETVPDWEDEYLDRVSDRLLYNYDLERDEDVDGERFALYGRMRVESQKQFLHPSINFANHASHEHLFARRASRVTVADLERLVDLGHDLADRWIEPDEEHFGTDFTFVLVGRFDDAVREFVSGFRDRTLLRFGYYGHYEVNLVAVDPETEDLVASPNADVAAAFRLWEDIPQERPGLLSRLTRRFGR